MFVKLGSDWVLTFFVSIQFKYGNAVRRLQGLRWLPIHGVQRRECVWIEGFQLQLMLLVDRRQRGILVDLLSN